MPRIPEKPQDGYETISINQPFHAPWYQVPPLDFVSENMVPHELRDERERDRERDPHAGHDGGRADSDGVGGWADGLTGRVHRDGHGGRDSESGRQQYRRR